MPVMLGERPIPTIGAQVGLVSSNAYRNLIRCRDRSTDEGTAEALDAVLEITRALASQVDALSAYLVQVAR